MVRPLSDIIRDTDEILARRAAGAEKIASGSDPEMSDDDIFKLAEQIRKAPEAAASEKKASEVDGIDLTLREKVAHAIALVDTLLNLPTLAKIAEFEEKARAQGYSDSEIAQQLEKTASVKFRSVLSEMSWLQPEG